MSTRLDGEMVAELEREGLMALRFVIGQEKKCSRKPL